MMRSTILLINGSKIIIYNVVIPFNQPEEKPGLLGYTGEYNQATKPRIEGMDYGKE